MAVVVVVVVTAAAVVALGFKGFRNGGGRVSCRGQGTDRSKNYKLTMAFLALLLQYVIPWLLSNCIPVDRVIKLILPVAPEGSSVI